MPKTKEPLKQTQDALLNPDKPMSSGGKSTLANAQAITPSKMFDDGGYVLKEITDMAEIASKRRCPKTEDEFIAAFLFAMQYCFDHKIPVSWPLICTFGFGCSLQYIERLMHDKNRAEIAERLAWCKDTLIEYLLAASMNGQLNPILCFHINKVYHGAVETNVVKFEIEDNRDVSQEEYERRLEILDVDNLSE